MVTLHVWGEGWEVTGIDFAHMTSPDGEVSLTFDEDQIPALEDLLVLLHALKAKRGWTKGSVFNAVDGQAEKVYGGSAFMWRDGQIVGPHPCDVRDPGGQGK